MANWEGIALSEDYQIKDKGKMYYGIFKRLLIAEIS